MSTSRVTGSSMIGWDGFLGPRIQQDKGPIGFEQLYPLVVLAMDNPPISHGFPAFLYNMW